MSEVQIAWPKKTRDIQEDTTDSTRWNDFVYRDDDIIIASWGKAGTTWIQQIVAQLVFDGGEPPTGDLSPWLDFVMFPKDQVLAGLEAQTHRRFVKTHLPVDALGIRPEVKYIYVARDGRDIVWSMHKFQTTGFDRAAGPMPEEAAKAAASRDPIDPDVRRYFYQWLERNGARYRPFFPHVQGWWNTRHLPNVLLVHYTNLKADMAGEMRHIADFLEIWPSAAAWPKILEHCTFDYMKRHAHQVAPKGARRMKGGGTDFFYKGTNGRWRDVLTAGDIKKYEEAVAKNLTLDCAHWLATGEMRS